MKTAKQTRPYFILKGILTLAISFTLLYAASTEASAGWCRVTDFQSFCYYISLSDCKRDAKSHGGVCVPK